MGNSQPKNLNFVKEETFKEPFKFFFKCDNINPLMKSFFWTPYNEADILYLESKFQEYQNGEKAAANELSIPIIVGGGMIDEQVCHYVGADYWVKDAMSGVRLCQKLMKK